MEKETKHLKDYNDPAMVSEDYYSAAEAHRAFSDVVGKRIKEVLMDEDEYWYFVQAFINQFPHDWKGENFMGVKIVPHSK